MALRTLTLGACCVAVVQGTSPSTAAACEGEEACDEDEASLLQKRAQVQQQEQTAEQEQTGEGLLDWWKPQDVSLLFYRPHFKCSWNEMGTAHVRAWLESVMDGTTNGQGEKLPQPDFVGLSEMQSTEGIPGGTRRGYGDYDLISSVCGKYKDPIALYYKKTHWKLLTSFPPSPLCRQYSPWPKGEASGGFRCTDGMTGPGKGVECCACTYSQKVAEATFYNGTKILWPNNKTSENMYQMMGDRPFVIGKFENTISKRRVCAVTFNLPHQFLANCTNQLDAACFTNAAGNAYRIGTDQLVKEINEVCEQTPLLFFGDTNIGAPDYKTNFIFSNPYNPEVASNAKACEQPAPLLSLTDPPSTLDITGEPYTCCNEEPTMMQYASDRIAASGPSWSAISGYFHPKHLLGGSRHAGEPIAVPLSVGIEASCAGVDRKAQGLPCCGVSPSEHAPVWGFFQLFR